jgi:hypothetical protein
MGDHRILGTVRPIANRALRARLQAELLVDLGGEVLKALLIRRDEPLLRLRKSQVLDWNIISMFWNASRARSSVRNRWRRGGHADSGRRVMIACSMN